MVHGLTCDDEFELLEHHLENKAMSFVSYAISRLRLSVYVPVSYWRVCVLHKRSFLHTTYDHIMRTRVSLIKFEDVDQVGDESYNTNALNRQMQLFSNSAAVINKDYENWFRGLSY